MAAVRPVAGVLLLLVIVAASNTAARADEVAARVGEVPIYASEIDAALVDALNSPEAAKAAGPALRARMLAQLVDQQLVLEYLAKKRLALSDAVLDKAIDEMKERLAARKITWREHLETVGLPEDAMRRQLRWRLSWRNYVATRVTEEALKSYFEANRADYDGRRVRYAQILFKPEKDDEASHDAAVAQANEVRKRIVAGELSFGDAARQFSIAPTADDGGDQGFISRNGETIEPIARTVFELDVDEISPPVVTQFGVHLFQVTEITPGELTIDDVRDELRQQVIVRGFAKLAEFQRQRTQVNYTGAAPYLDPESGKLMQESAAGR